MYTRKGNSRNKSIQRIYDDRYYCGDIDNVRGVDCIGKEL